MTKKYQIIYADPPWQYNDRRLIRKDGKPNRCGYGAVNHYQTLSLNEIASLPMSNLADDNCALFMWCTFPMLDEQIGIFKDWGFKYKTIGFAWVKTNRENNAPSFGVGYYAKSNIEICLLGIKGKMKPISNSVSSVVTAPRREHSRKPDEVRDRIVKLFGDLPRIELFSREQHPGWDTWGNETDKLGNDYLF